MFVIQIRVGSIQIIDRIIAFLIGMYRTKSDSIKFIAIYLNVCFINGFCHVRKDLKNVLSIRAKYDKNNANDIFHECCNLFKDRIILLLDLVPKNLS